MHDPKIIEAMARAIEAASGSWFEAAPDAVDDCAERALTALCTLHPGVAALLSGEAVAVPRGILESLCADAEALLRHNCGDPPHPALKRRYDRDVADILEARRLLAASPWAQEEKRDAE